MTTVVETTEGAPMRVEEAISDVGAAAAGGAPPTTAQAAAIAEMRDHFNKANAALTAGNLAVYAEEIKKAEAALTKLEKIKR